EVRGPGGGPREGRRGTEAVARATVAVDVVEAHEAVADVHEDAVSVLHTGVVAPRRRVVAAVERRTARAAGLADAGDVVDDGRRHGLPVGLLRAVGLEHVVARARALGDLRAVPLDEQAELRLAAPALVDVEAVVADVPDVEVLDVDRA